MKDFLILIVEVKFMGEPYFPMVIITKAFIRMIFHKEKENMFLKVVNTLNVNIRTANETEKELN